jgi:hypothetical protein
MVKNSSIGLLYVKKPPVSGVFKFIDVGIGGATLKYKVSDVKLTFPHSSFIFTQYFPACEIRREEALLKEEEPFQL